jgi:periplasmic protein TonB
MMDSIQPGKTSSRTGGSGPLFSAMAHGIVIVALLGLMHQHTHLEPFRLPGTKSGVQFLTYYSPGSTHAAVNTVRAKVVDKPVATPTIRPVLSTPKPEISAALDSRPGDANSGQSGLGDGNITIALQKYFPYPKPSLASLAPGTAGDVILKAVIDEHGKITELTLVAGLGPAIDDEVIKTVNEWVYTPAMKDGAPVPSVEELHFHYEKRG